MQRRHARNRSWNAHRQGAVLAAAGHHDALSVKVHVPGGHRGGRLTKIEGSRQPEAGIEGDRKPTTTDIARRRVHDRQCKTHGHRRVRRVAAGSKDLEADPSREWVRGGDRGGGWFGGCRSPAGKRQKRYQQHGSHGRIIGPANGLRQPYQSKIRSINHGARNGTPLLVVGFSRLPYLSCPLRTHHYGDVAGADGAGGTAVEDASWARIKAAVAR